jgi:hypothetical protein
MCCEYDQIPYSQHNIFFVTYEWPINLEYYITLSWKRLDGTNTLAYCANLEVMKKILCCEYDPRAIFTALYFLRYL